MPTRWQRRTPRCPLPPEGASGVTSETGTFAIRLDPATYQLEVEASSRAARGLQPFVQVPLTGSRSRSPFRMPTGRTLTARVLRDAGTRVSQALVRVYHQVTVQDDGTPRALLLGQGVSDENGTVRILLAAAVSSRPSGGEACNARPDGFSAPAGRRHHPVEPVQRRADLARVLHAPRGVEVLEVLELTEELGQVLRSGASTPQLRSA